MKYVCVRFFFCKQKTAYEMRISDWSSDVCSSDLLLEQLQERAIGIVQQVARQQCDRAVHRDRFVDFAIAPESAAATVEQPQYPVRRGGAVAQEAAVVIGQARAAIAQCAPETGAALVFARHEPACLPPHGKPHR